MKQTYDLLAGQLKTLIQANCKNDSLLIAGIQGLATLHGDEVYRNFFLLMTGKRFSTTEALNHWQESLRHRESFINPEYHDAALLPSLFHYLHTVVCELEFPRVIEFSYLDNVMLSSVTDGLTGLYNQAYFKGQLSKFLNLTKRNDDYCFSLILLDLDHFKNYNDTLGHLAGDKALKCVADIIRSCLREYDIAARYGGEEFGLLLPSTDKTTAFTVAERIRSTVEAEFCQGRNLMSTGSLTISGGIALSGADGSDLEGLIVAADKELYRAKSQRNSIYPVGDDRRNNIRKKVNSLVEYATLEGSLFRPALSIDISEKGMAIGCENLFVPGTPVNLRFTRPFWVENHQATAVVRQCRRQGELVYVGLEFEDCLDSLLMERLSCEDSLTSNIPIVQYS